MGRLEALIAAGGSGADAVLLSEVLAHLRGLQREADSLRRRYTSLFDAVPDPVSIIDPEGRIIDLNKAGERAYRRPREEIVGKLVHVINPDLPRDHMGPVLEALARDETYVVEVKTGKSGPDPKKAATRRQLREYAAIYEADGLLLADMTAERLHAIEFPTKETRPSRARMATVFLIGAITIVAVAACAIPVRRAIRVDPAVALRTES